MTYITHALQSILEGAPIASVVQSLFEARDDLSSLDALKAATLKVLKDLEQYYPPTAPAAYVDYDTPHYPGPAALTRLFKELEQDPRKKRWLRSILNQVGKEMHRLRDNVPSRLLAQLDQVRIAVEVYKGKKR